MAMILNLLSLACSIVVLVCFVMVVVQMFKRNESTIGIVSIVGLFVCGIGVLVAFVYGWTKVKAWDLQKVMIAWTIAIVFNFVLTGLTFALAVGAAASAGPDAFNMDPDDMNFEIDMDGATFDSDGTNFEMPEGADFSIPDTTATPVTE